MLRYGERGYSAYYNVIAKESLISGSMNGYLKWNHNTFWTETWANYLSSQYFGSNYIPSVEFPIQDISKFNLFRIFISNPHINL